MMKFLVKDPPKRPREGDVAEDGDAAAKAARPASLSPEVTALLAHLTDETWKTALSKEVGKTYFAELAQKVQKDRAAKTVYPPAPDVFTAFNLTPLPAVRVVILGQDPYHGPQQAHGLSFSVCRGVGVPPSLKNIYTELESDLADTSTKFRRPSHGHLAAWARRGVLLLNATLTVRAGEANSHQAYGWQTFTDAVVKQLNARAEPIVFILWGNFARTKGKSINRERHCVIETAHPSPLSVTKFRGCKCFSQANDFLRKRRLEPIDWSLDEDA